MYLSLYQSVENSKQNNFRQFEQGQLNSLLYYILKLDGKFWIFTSILISRNTQCFIHCSGRLQSYLTTQSIYLMMSLSNTGGSLFQGNCTDTVLLPVIPFPLPSSSTCVLIWSPRSRVMATFMCLEKAQKVYNSKHYVRINVAITLDLGLQIYSIFYILTCDREDKPYIKCRVFGSVP